MSTHSVYYTVTRMDDNESHTCNGVFHGNYRQVQARFIAQQFIAKLRDQPSYRPIDMQKDIQRELNIAIPYKRA